jgi:hypothetical protein
MNRYYPLKILLLGALALTAPAAPEAGKGIPAGAPEQQRKFCATLLSWNEEYSRRVKAPPTTAKHVPTPDAASDQGLAELYAFIGPTGAFKGWRGHASILVNGGSARVDLQACYMRNEIAAEMVDVHLGGGGIPADSPLAKSLASINTAKDIVVSGVFLSRKWPNNLEQFMMMPRDIRHPAFEVRVTSVAQTR